MKNLRSKIMTKPLHKQWKKMKKKRVTTDVRIHLWDYVSEPVGDVVYHVLHHMKTELK